MIGQAARRLARVMLRRIPPARRAAQAALRTLQMEQAFLAEQTIGEISPLGARASKLAAPRVNLLLPGISRRHFFGGAHTALQFLETVGAGVDTRIIVTDERLPIDPDPSILARWPRHEAAAEDRPGPQLVVAGARGEGSIALRAGERFIATIWWSAHLAQQLIAWQRTQLGTGAPMLYLIQDFEPGFYPWSSRFALAEQSYRFPDTIAVFNSRALADYFSTQGYAFRERFVFEPIFNPRLAAQIERQRHTPKRRRILVYGRPSVPRNAFGLIVAGLHEWSAGDPQAAQWELLSVGEAHPEVPLGAGLALRSLGKLDLDGYAQVLGESAIGISLMISPHPSYPPLEMAAFGLRTISNRFGPKDLAHSAANIESLAELSPGALARHLGALTAAFEQHLSGDDPRPWCAMGSAPPAPPDPFPFADQLRAAWLK